MTARASNSRTGRTPAARRAAAGLGGLEPMVFGKRDPAAEKKADRVIAFEVDGVPYSVPAVVPTGDGLTHLLVTRGMPDETAKGAYLVRELAGPDALAALLAEADMTDEQWHELAGRLGSHAYGRLEGTSGN